MLERSKIKYYILLCVGMVLGLCQSNVLAANIEVKLIDENGKYLSGGSYADPEIINTNIIRWKVEVADFGATSGSYTTFAKMAGSRSSPCRQEHTNLSYSDLQNRIFEWEGAAGMYTITANDNGYNEDKAYVHCRVPPINNFSLPYSPPKGNHPPQPKMTVLNNVVSGLGTEMSPYIINEPIIKFSLDDMTDPDGLDDLRYGAFHWVVRNQGQHEIYSGGSQNCSVDPCRTFLFWDDDIDGKIFEWDVRGRPSDNNRYDFGLYAIDQYGERGVNNSILSVITQSSYTESCSCENWIDQGCGVHCFPNQMFQTRICNPPRCDNETWCMGGLSQCSSNPGPYPINQCSTRSSVSQKPEISLVKSVNKQQTISGDILIYSLVYTNVSKFTAYNIIIKDQIASNLEYIEGSATGNSYFQNNELRWVVAELSPGSSRQVNFQIKVK